MRTADLKPDTEYATCNGELVIPVEPIHAYYAWVQLKNGKNKIKDVSKQVQRGEVPKTGTDPWGQCHRAPSGRKVRVDPIIGRRGVLMTRYEVDRDGVRIEDTGRQKVVEPGDIKGTWVQYLTLYGHVVRERVDEATAKLEKEQRLADIQRALDGAFPDCRVSIDVYTFSGGSVRIELRRDGEASIDALQALAEELGVQVDQ